MRHPPSSEMRCDSHALPAEQCRVPGQTRKAPWLAWWNSRESPTTLSQDQKNTDITPGMQNCSVYPKSIWDEANFPCIGSITTPRSTTFRTSGLTPFRNLYRLPETTVPGWGRFLERVWESTPVFLPGEFNGQEEPGRLPSMGSQRVRQDWVTITHTYTHTHRQLF